MASSWMCCASCNKKIHRSRTSLPSGEARCRECRRTGPIPHGTTYGRQLHRQRGEPLCDPCRLAWNEDCRARRKAAQARGWVRPDRQGRPRWACDSCGKVIANGRAGRARDGLVLCKLHRDEKTAQAKRAKARRRQAAAKLDRAAQGIAPNPRWPFVAGACAECLQPFVRRGQSSRFCSGPCRRRARARYGHIAHRDRLAIYDRDGWTCQICLDPVDPDLMATDPLSNWAPSLDHIEPQAHALIPDHSPSNLRLAHRWCNSVRGDLSFYTDDDLRRGDAAAA
jgi:hypothetical protein